MKIGFIKFLINNEWVESVFGKRFEIINFVIGEVICNVVEVDVFDVDKVVIVVCKVFISGEWLKIFVVKWGEFLYKLVDLIEKNIEELVRLEILDNGKLFKDFFNIDLFLAIVCYCYYVGWVDKV